MSLKTEAGWTTLHVPREVLDVIKQIREKENKATWEIILEALRSRYSVNVSKNDRKIDDALVDRVSFEIMKLANNFVDFLRFQTIDKYEVLMKRLQEIQNVLEIDTSDVQKLTEQYFKSKSVEDKEKLFDAYQKLIKKIIIEVL